MIKKAIGLVLLIVGILGILRESFVVGGLLTVFGSYLVEPEDNA